MPYKDPEQAKISSHKSSLVYYTKHKDNPVWRKKTAIRHNICARERYAVDPLFRAKGKIAREKYRVKLSPRCGIALRIAEREALSQGYLPCNATWEELSIALEAQKYCCAITGISEEHVSSRVYMDHDHLTGRFHRWISLQANVLLGMAKENAQTLRAALRYIGDTNV